MDLKFLKRVRGVRPGEYPEWFAQDDSGGEKKLVAMLGPRELGMS